MKIDLNQQKSKITARRVVIFFLILLFLIGVGYIARFNRFFTSINTQKNIWITKTPKEKTVFSFLVMGYGGAGHQGAFLTDTMMIARVDIKKKTVYIISIPRDIWVKVPTKSGDDFHSKINSVYQMGLFPKNYRDIPKQYHGDQGAAELVKQVTATVVGFPIDYYVAIDFAGFTKAVDTLGGVEVYVDRAFTDPEYPINGKEKDVCEIEGDELEEAFKLATQEPQLAFPCRYETLRFDVGTTFMDGETALKYVRSRHAPEDGGDFGRARRQQRFMDAVKDKILAVGFIPKILPLLDDLEGNVRTDVPLEIAQKFLREADNTDDYEVGQVILTTDNYLKESVSSDGQYILIPKVGIGSWGRLKRDLENMFEGITPTVSPLPSHTKRNI
ncbi:MAG: LCP family protein [Candidatus Paceibacterota bacterium]